MTGASRLDGKTAVVTGAGRGIGRSTALALAGLGARVVGLARSTDELDEVVRAVRARGGDARELPTDVGNALSVARVIERINSDVGVIDVLVNNADVVWPLGPSVELDVTEWARAIAINLLDAVHLA